MKAINISMVEINDAMNDAIAANGSDSLKGGVLLLAHHIEIILWDGCFRSAKRISTAELELAVCPAYIVSKVTNDMAIQLKNKD